MSREDSLKLKLEEPDQDMHRDIRLHAKQVFRNARFLGTLLVTGKNRRGAPVSTRNHMNHQADIAFAIRWLKEGGYGIELAMGTDDAEDSLVFTRYYQGDMDQNPHLITADETAMDIEDFCKHVYYGATMAIVATASAITYSNPEQQATKKG